MRAAMLLVLAAAVGRGALAKPSLKIDRVAVPAGAFTYGSTHADDERPVQQRRLPAYKIDRTEVTRSMYAACVAAKRCRPPVATTAAMIAAQPDLPMTDVNWSEARSFCAYAGGRLPTEAEWEKAARGSDGREFPWGNDLDCAHANWGNFDGEGPCMSKNPGHPVTVGTYPAGASPFGALDLAGNVWEWVEDTYDIKSDIEPTRRVVRGGSCCSYFVFPRSANRNAWAPHHRDADLGFRCVSK